MAERANMRLLDTTVHARLDPAGACPVCASKVTEAEAAISIRAVPGDRDGNTITMNVSVVAATLTALPCGHVIHEQRSEDDDD